MYQMLTRLIGLVLLFTVSYHQSYANDSDVVNCGRPWKIVVIGSSTAYGTGASIYDSSWVGRYNSYLLRRNTASQIINLAIPGYVTYQTLRPDGYIPPSGRPSPETGYNITAALNLHPDAIIINMPSNDAANNYTIEEQQANFEAATTLADSANIPVWITTTQPRNFSDPDRTLLLFSLKDWLYTRYGNKILNFWDDVANPDGSINSFYNFDNVHVNNFGHQLFFYRVAASNILDSLCNRLGTLQVTANNPGNIILPVNTVSIAANAISSNGTVVSYSWRRISGPVTFSINDLSASSTLINNLIEGNYAFEVTATDDLQNIAKDTISFSVSSRLLIDFGSTTTSSPDANNYFWNNLSTAVTGAGISNVITTENTNSGMTFEVLNRIDGTFNLAGPGTNTGNTTGDVNDYPLTATTDYAFAHPSATNGQWRLSGLDSLRNYRIKFWGTRSVSDPRVIEIKDKDSANWQSYDAAGNTNYDQAAVFNISGKSTVTFDIRVASGSPFGYIGILDIIRSVPASLTNIPPVAQAGNDTMIIFPTNSITLDGGASYDIDGTVVAYTWRKISGPPLYNISSPNAASTTVSNLTEGRYLFELKVTDDQGGTDRDTIAVLVGSRILIDFGATNTAVPDQNGNYWNNVNTAANGVILSNAINTNNFNTGLGLTVVNRIDGTFNSSGSGTNTGNTIGDVNDYPNSATTDYAFAHPSATNGQWKFTGLDSNKTYMIKFWGTRSVADPRIIEIKLNEDNVWKSYNAASNSNYLNAANFSFTGKSEALFDIRVESGSPFGYISLVDIIKTTNPSASNLLPVAIAGEDIQLTSPATSAILNGSNSYDLDGDLVAYEWSQINGPNTSIIVSPNNPTSTIQNLTLGTYEYQLKVTDDRGDVGLDTIRVFVSERILFDFGNALTPSPDSNGRYWNNVTTANEGVKVVNAVNVDNTSSGISMEVVSRIDGTFNPGGPGVNTANTIGVVEDYPNSATADYAFAHPSAINGQWKFSGLDSTKEYTIKFWGARNATDPRIIEIKTEDDTTWRSYNAANNNDYNNAAYFEITHKTSVVFNIRVQNGSPFGYIAVVDINATKPNCSPDSSLTNISACESYTWNGNTYTASGTYTFTTTNSNGCDSVATLNLTINNATSSDTSITACDSYTWNSNTYTTSGTYTFTTTNSNGCDSVATLNLTINNATSSDTNITACESYIWNGNTYNASGTYTITTTNSNGCDSVATLNLTIALPSAETITVKACSGYSWFGTTYVANGTYTHIIPNAAGCDSVMTLELTIVPLPFNIGNITGPTNACNYSGINGSEATYSVSTINADSIVWEIPEDAILIAGEGTNTIQVLFSSSFSAGFITVTCYSPCGAPQIRTLAISKRIPNTPLAIQGPVNICNVVGTSQTVNYSIAPVANALKYRWNLPSSVTIVSANSDSSSINVTVNNTFASVVNKIVKVQSVGLCGVSSFSTLALSATLPFIPARLYGPSNSCLHTDQNNPAVYYVNQVSNATSYSWSVPAGATIIEHPGGNGINDTIIKVIFNSNFVSGSSISVSSVAPCGISSPRTISISSIQTSAPYRIYGVTTICVSSTSTLTEEYFINKMPQANGYFWTAPANSTLEHINGLGENDTIVRVTYNSSFTSGNLSVAAYNGCNTSQITSYSLTKLTLATPVIQGPINSCLYQDSAARYIIRKINGATSYNWVAPTDVLSFVHLNPPGVNDTVVDVIFANTFIRGNISVSAIASCTSSGVRNFAISRRTVGIITNLYSNWINAECPSRKARYSIPAFPANATGVTWTVPQGAIIDSGQGTTNIYVTYNADAVSNQYVTVAGYNGCGYGAAKKLLINLPQCPSIPFAGNYNQGKTQMSNNKDETLRFKVTPNPSRYAFKLKNDNPYLSSFIIMIFDATGRWIETRHIQNYQEELVFGATFKSGLYFVNIFTQKDKTTLKVIKQ